MSRVFRKGQLVPSCHDFSKRMRLLLCGQRQIFRNKDLMSYDVQGRFTFLVFLSLGSPSITLTTVAILDVKSLWVVVANAAYFFVVKKMRLFSLFFTLLILLAACTGSAIKKNVLDKIPGAGTDEMQIGVAPDRKCPPPKQMDPQGNCRQPWGR
jgi:hypothetical protein